MKTGFTSQAGRLYAGGIPLEDLAASFGTPLYIYAAAAIDEQVAAVRAAFDPHGVRMLYSVKANSNLHLLRHLLGLGLGFDIVSGGELARLIEVGADPREIVFAGVGKTGEELQAAVTAGVGLIIAESVGEVQRLARIAGSTGRTPLGIGLRLNPEVDAGTHRHITTGRRQDKFGLLVEEYRTLLTDGLWRGPLRLTGLHIHLGSQITSVAPYRTALTELLERLAEARAAGHEVRILDLGGGFGISYDGSPVPTPADYAAALAPLLAGLDVAPLIELGRSLVGPAGVLLTRVEYVKPRDNGHLLIVDAGMTELLRPALYQAHHRIEPVRVPAVEERLDCDIAGPLCESSDFLARGRSLPPLEPGDLLAVRDVGAYGLAMSGNYNSRLRPAEVWVDLDGDVRLIRRRETHDDLLAPERDFTS
jgi:diaminopimelate decarboxylase